ncbi:MAG TPA: UDP-N-acetylmuramate--L-alanine ligase [Candidatus Eisenbacteria bacterium]|nr:UDP-N-acetylmuramate--L-alanine ligase [Candidatus Eisenbacteria bacterium]
MYGRIRRIHLVGIGGSGMSGIAEVLLNLGYEVSGSDTKESEVVGRLRGLGATIAARHDAANVESAEVVVASTAIAESNPELLRAHERGIPVIPRAEMLAELMRIKYSVAVAGAHGKTTTTSMVGEILAHGGLDPTVIVGGRLKALGAHARLGQGPFLVAEADESDGSFLFLSPTIAVITNVDEEHLDYYGSIEKIREAFATFVNRVPFYGTIVLPADEPNAASLRLKAKRRTITYSLGADADVEGRDLVVGPAGVKFALRIRGRDEGTIELKVTGIHNARNALAAIAAGWELGVPVAAIRDALHEFAGVGRRLETRGTLQGALWIDDYAHHPTEIAAAVAAIRATHGRRIVAVFQPHRYTRTMALLDRFAGCFAGVAELVLLPIYPAGEKPIPGVTADALAERVTKQGGTRVRRVADHAEAATVVRGLLGANDVFLTIGAGDVYRVGELARTKEHAA